MGRAGGKGRFDSCVPDGGEGAFETPEHRHVLEAAWHGSTGGGSPVVAPVSERADEGREERDVVVSKSSLVA